LFCAEKEQLQVCLTKWFSTPHKKHLQKATEKYWEEEEGAGKDAGRNKRAK